MTRFDPHYMADEQKAPNFLRSCTFIGLVQLAIFAGVLAYAISKYRGMGH